MQRGITALAALVMAVWVVAEMPGERRQVMALPVTLDNPVVVALTGVALRKNMVVARSGLTPSEPLPSTAISAPMVETATLAVAIPAVPAAASILIAPSLQAPAQ